MIRILSAAKKIVSSRQQGGQAERLAENYLRIQGLRFVERNYHCRHGEIDLIMEDKDMLVFVEVRYRRKNTFGKAIETIDHRKQKKIIRTAQYYLHRHNLTESCHARFDVVGLEPKLASTRWQDANTANLNFDWIKNAFNLD